MAGDHSYSPDVEIDHGGKLVFARDIAVGDVICIPGHMMGRVVPMERDSLTPDGQRAIITIRRRPT